MSESPELKTYRRLKTLLVVADVLVFLVAMTLMLYWVITERGLVGILLDLELRLFEWASLKLTALVAFVIIWLPSFFVLRLLLRPLINRRDAIESRLTSGGSLSPAEAAHDPLFENPGSEAGLLRMRKWSIVGLFAGIAVAAISIGLYEKRDALFGAQRDAHRVQTVDLAAADPPRFIAAKGVALSPIAYGWEEGRSGSGRKHVATPVVPSTWRKGEPIRYFIVSNGDPERSGDRTYPIEIEGEVTKNGLPTFVTGAYERERWPVADPHYVIKQGLPAPDSDFAEMSVWGAIAGGIIAIFGVVALISASASLRKLRQGTPA